MTQKDIVIPGGARLVVRGAFLPQAGEGEDRLGGVPQPC
jgi:hypothetical protein